jgi:hypothetical protein
MKPRPGVRSALAFTLLAVLSTAAAWAEPTPKVIAVANRAEWCSVCKANGERAGRALMKASADGTIKVLVNDVTSEETIKKSIGDLRAAGLDKIMTSYTATGVLYFFDARTRRPLRQVTVANSDEEIRMVAELAKKDSASQSP